MNVEFRFSHWSPKLVIWNTFWEFGNSKYPIRRYNEYTYDTIDKTLLFTSKIAFIGLSKYNIKKG